PAPRLARWRPYQLALYIASNSSKMALRRNGGADPDRPVEADPAPAPDPGAPGAADPRASAGARGQVAGHAGARARAGRDPLDGVLRVRGAGRLRPGAGARRAGHVRRR